MAGSRTIESVPLVLNGRMYVSWPFCHVAALDPETGRQLWRYTASRCAFAVLAFLHAQPGLLAGR